MKKISLAISLLLLYFMAAAQNCMVVTTAFFTANPDGQTANLTVNWNAFGQEHINVTVSNNTGIILTSCITSANTGITSGSRVFTGLSGNLSNLSASFTPYTGVCQGGTACGQALVLTPGSGQLPIKIIAFDAMRNGNMVYLKWVSQNEVNAKEFILERSTDNVYLPVATIAAVNNGGGFTYTFNDNNNSKTLSLYRIKMVEQSGAYTYSDTRAVKGTAAVNNFTIFPNPSTGSGNVTISDIIGSTSIQILGFNGILIKTVELNNSNSIALPNLQKGIYLLKITSKATGETETRKLTINN